MRRRLLLVAATSLCSCAVGPNFKTPAPPQVAGYTAQPLPQQTGADAQKYVRGWTSRDSGGPCSVRRR